MQVKLSQQLRIFLLYAHSDQEVVRRLYQRLGKDGASVWLDEKRILPGQDWEYEIRKAIHGSDMIIVCLSRQFIKQGGYRHQELKIALERAKSLPESEIFLVPARLEKCDMPKSLRRWQRVDLFEMNGYGKLLSALKKQAASA